MECANFTGIKQNNVPKINGYALYVRDITAAGLVSEASDCRESEVEGGWSVRGVCAALAPPLYLLHLLMFYYLLSCMCKVLRPP